MNTSASTASRPAAPAAPAAGVPAARRHDIDALRALAFALVILYHLGMYYVADWPWHVKSPHAAAWLQWPMRLLNLWRMDLVFLVSGVSLALLAQGRPAGALLRRRAWRLLLPLVFGMVVVVPWQAYAQGVANGLVAPGFGAFLLRYLWPGGARWPAAAFDGAEFGITWNHLWFLPYLFAYTAVALLAIAVLRRPGLQRLTAALQRRVGAALPSRPVPGAFALVCLPMLPLLAAAVWLAPRFPPTHDLLHDAWLHVRYGTAFGAGCLLGGRGPWWQTLVAVRRRVLLVALAGACAVVAAREAGLAGPWALWAGVTARTVYGWSALLAILGHARLHLDRPWPWLGWAREAVYPWYVLHQSLLILAIGVVAPWGLGPVAEPLLLLAATVLGCWWLTDGVVRRVRWLRPLFGLAPMRATRSSAAPARAAAD